MHCMLIVSDYRKFVITSLTKIKYDLSDLTALSHSVNASNMILESGGDSVRRLMAKMFEDKVLLEFSLKKSFKLCKVYHLLIDAIRVHPKFQNLVDREFDVALATWLAH
ncbi:DUF4806 domain-containing protein, partial [Aphis craccivora]